MISKPIAKHKRTGDLAENQALQHLTDSGLTLVTRNYRCKLGEIDLIMQDENHLVFVEVRFRKNSAFGSALESVTVAKQHKVILATQHYLAQHNIGESKPSRFDVVGISPDNIEWIKNAF